MRLLFFGAPGGILFINHNDYKNIVGKSRAKIIEILASIWFDIGKV